MCQKMITSATPNRIRSEMPVTDAACAASRKKCSKVFYLKREVKRVLRFNYKIFTATRGTQEKTCLIYISKLTY